MYLLVVYIVMMAATCKQNQHPFSSSVPCTVIKDIPYSSGAQFCGSLNQNQQNLDVYIPQVSSYGNSKPLIIFIHGGGFTKGDKQNIYNFVENQVKHILNNGWAFATINYRLLSLNNNCQNELCGVRDKCLDDIARCVKFIKANASTYGIDKNRIGLIGVSAGATAALWIGLDGFEQAYGPNNTHFGMPALDNESTKVKAIYCDVPQGSLDIREWDIPVFEGQCNTYDLNQNDIFSILTVNKPCYVHAMYGVGNNFPSGWPFTGINSYLDDIALIQLSNSATFPNPKVYIRNTNQLANLNGSPNANTINHHPLQAYGIKNALTTSGFNVCWEIPSICFSDKANCPSGWVQFFNNNL